jgi:light-regulated signal transduction histidine kinase (bacteriophytochrome)
MGHLIDDLLSLARVHRLEMSRGDVDLGAMVREIVDELRRREPARRVDVAVAAGVRARADGRLLRAAIENLVGNAWKFTGKSEVPRIAFGCERRGDVDAYFVRDNGAGFDMKYADRLFGAFQRLHTDKEYSGTGIGLATCQRIVVRHGGRIWADAAVGTGATFQFTLPES